MKNFSGVCQAAGADKPLRAFFIWITNIVTLINRSIFCIYWSSSLKAYSLIVKHTTVLERRMEEHAFTVFLISASIAMGCLFLSGEI
jgi:hypothetical protein